MERHWGAVRDWLVAVFRYQGIEEAVAEELALLPGAEELAALLAVEEQVRSGAFDLVVVDCAPTGSALRLLALPELARSAFRVLLRVQRTLATVITPLARSVLAMPLPDAAVFRDAEGLIFRRLVRLRRLVVGPGTSVRLVVTPERMVIDEARRAWTELSLFEVACDAVIMNRLLPKDAAEEAFFREWGRLQEDRRREVEDLFAPLPVLAAPLAPDEVTGIVRLAEHGARIFAGVAPDALLSSAPRVRFSRDGESYLAIVPLPGADPARLDVTKIDDELTITTGVRRRMLKLPRRIAPLSLASAKLEGPSLVVRFVRPAGGTEAV
jgi:arsenite-transporting ATPase